MTQKKHVEGAPGKKLDPAKTLCGAHHTLKTNQVRARRQTEASFKQLD
jgi:hypothetical protein